MYPVLLRECNVITTVNFTLCIIKPRTGILYLSITFAHREEFRCRPVKNLLHHTAVTPCLYNSTPNDAATDDTTAVGRAQQSARRVPRETMLDGKAITPPPFALS